VRGPTLVTIGLELPTSPSILIEGVRRDVVSGPVLILILAEGVAGGVEWDKAGGCGVESNASSVDRPGMEECLLSLCDRSAGIGRLVDALKGTEEWQCIMRFKWFNDASILESYWDETI